MSTRRTELVVRLGRLELPLIWTAVAVGIAGGWVAGCIALAGPY